MLFNNIWIFILFSVLFYCTGFVLFLRVYRMSYFRLININMYSYLNIVFKFIIYILWTYMIKKSYSIEVDSSSCCSCSCRCSYSSLFYTILALCLKCEIMDGFDFKVLIWLSQPDQEHRIIFNSTSNSTNSSDQ